MDTEITEAKLYTAFLHYQQHREAAKRYYENHKDQCNEASRKWFANMKADPERYKAYVEKRKEQMRKRREAQKEKEVATI